MAPISWMVVYNTSFHSAIKMTPFQALYDKTLNVLAEAALYPTDSVDILPSIITSEQTASQIKHNLLRAQEGVKHFANKKRTKNFGSKGHGTLKTPVLQAHILKYSKMSEIALQILWTIQVSREIGNVSYKLRLPEDSQVHHTFHTSQLMNHLGPPSYPIQLPLLHPDGTILLEPEKLLER